MSYYIRNRTILFLFLLRCSSDGRIILPPVNTEAVVGDTIALICGKDTKGCCAKWEHNAVGKENVDSVTSDTKITVKYHARFLATWSIDSGFYNLTIKNVQREDAGKYWCSDPNSPEQERQTLMANLIVLDTPPICWSNMSDDGVITENDCNLEPDYIHLSCSVNYLGNIPPRLEWVNLKDGDMNNTELDNRVTNSMATKAAWKKSFFINFACQTKLLKRPCHTGLSYTMYVFNATEEITTINHIQSLSCSANSSSTSCRYEWRSKDGTVQSKKSDFQLTEEFSSGEYHCQAECNLRGTSCPVLVRSVLYTKPPPEKSALAISFIAVTPLVVVESVLLIIMAIRKIRCCRACCTACCTACKRRCQKSRNRGSDDVEARLIKPTVAGTISPEAFKLWKGRKPNCIKDQRTAGNVKGLTILQNKFYLVKYGKPCIEEYDAETFENSNTIPVPKLKEARDIVSCRTHNCLYVSDSGNQTVHTVFVQEVKTKIWPIGEEPKGLSVAYNTDVIVCCKNKHIKVFDSGGNLKHTVHTSKKINYLRHAILLQDKQFIICHGSEKNVKGKNRVSIMNMSGNVVRQYDGTKDTSPKLEWPTRLALSADGCILVLDLQRQGVVLLDSELKRAEELILFDAQNITRMALDENNDFLYTTQNEKDGSIRKFTLNSIALNSHGAGETDADYNVNETSFTEMTENKPKS